MATCIFCGNNYSIERKKIGYRSCLSCGDKTADKQIKEKASRCMPAFNKGGYQYVQGVKTILNYKGKRK